MDLELERIESVQGDVTVESNRVFGYPLHTHTYCEMIMYEAFDGSVRVNGEEISPRSITAVILSPLDFHQITVRDACDAEYIKVGFHPDTPHIPPVDTSVVLEGIGEDSFLRALFCEMREQAGNTPYLTRLVGCAVCHILQNGRKIFPLGEPRINRVALDALRMINGSFREELSLSLVAERLSVTPQYLSHAFKQGFGVNFSQYLTHTRIKYAASMMLNTRAGITDICFESGFENFSHFSRSFKKLYGLSPREYRNQYSKI